MTKKTVVVALGGNAIKQADQKGTYLEQKKNIEITCKEIVKLIKADYKVVVTHGNGPQAGNLLIQQEKGSESVPPQPLDVVGSMTQGQIGYMIQQTLFNMLKSENILKDVISIVNQVRVDKDDEGFKNPTKPVGPFFNKDQVESLKVTNPDWIIKEVKPESIENRFRRVVASPKPVENMESNIIKKLVDSDILVIASGGGGVPVYYDKDQLNGIAAVIDKDLAGELLAETLNADIFLILTDVSNAFINYGKENQESVGVVKVDQIKSYLNQSHFGSGSMKPKVEAALKFVENTQNKAIITSLDKAFKAITGDLGTQIII